LALAAGSDGSLWAGINDRGLGRLKDGKVTAYTPRDGLAGPGVRCVLQDRRGDLWVGTETGLSRLRGGRFTSYHTRDGLAHDCVFALHQDHGGDLWIGTPRGLSRYRGGAFTAYAAAQGLPAEQVFAIHGDAHDALWLATDRGLVRCRDGHFTPCPLRDPVFNGFLWAVVDDRDGNLWLTSNRGVARVPRAGLEAFVRDGTRPVGCTHYTTADGLPSPDCSGTTSPAAWRAADGRIWFATSRGAAVVDPSRLRRNGVPPAVVIEQVVIDKRPVAPGGPASLPPGRGDLEVRYTGLSFTAPERVSFQVRLEGYDPDWVEAGGTREAHYTNLPPGPYTFRVRACNADGVWNEAGAAFAFYLAPHFYQTWWFYGACAAAAGLGAVAAHGLRVRGLKARERELSRRVDDRTEALRLTADKLRQSKEAAEAALARVKQLQGLLPICCYCKRVRDGKDYWQQVEAYVMAHSEAQFTHGICPDCFEKQFGPVAADEAQAERAPEQPGAEG
jgi:hypothetical protein